MTTNQTHQVESFTNQGKLYIHEEDVIEGLLLNDNPMSTDHGIRIDFDDYNPDHGHCKRHPAYTGGESVCHKDGVESVLPRVFLENESEYKIPPRRRVIREHLDDKPEPVIDAAYKMKLHAWKESVRENLADTVTINGETYIVEYNGHDEH